MKLYEINQEIEKAFEECLDLETGEIKDFSKLEELTLAKNDKVREIALFIINLEGEERLIDEQIKKFLARRKTIKNKISGLKAYLQYHTEGESYTFTEVKVFYRQSEETEITDAEALEKYCKRHKELGSYEFKPSKTAIREAILRGLNVKGAEVIRKAKFTGKIKEIRKMKATAIQTLMVIQSILKAPKSQYNSFGKYNYRNCEDILEALKPICKEYNSAVVLTDDVVTIGDRYYVKATATLYCFDENGVDSISASAFAREEQDKKGMDGSQVTGASSSYARKYALNGLFGIDDTKDSDTTNKGENKPQTEAPKQEHVKAEEKPTMTYEQALEHICEVNGMTIKAIFKDVVVRTTIDDLYRKSSAKTRQAFDIVKAEIKKHNESKN